MSNRFCVAAVAAALVALQPVSAAEPQTAPSTDKPAAPADKKAEKPKEKKICHREVPTGSITPVRICHTQSEIDSEAQRSQGDLEQMNRMQRAG